jgi:hypothetical protein
MRPDPEQLRLIKHRELMVELTRIRLAIEALGPTDGLLAAKDYKDAPKGKRCAKTPHGKH